MKESISDQTTHTHTRTHARTHAHTHTQFFKWKTRKLNFRFYALNLVWINITFYLSNVGSPKVDFSSSRAKIVELSGPIYLAMCCTIVKWSRPICRPSTPNRQFFGRFIGQSLSVYCHSSSHALSDNMCCYSRMYVMNNCTINVHNLVILSLIK